jgi:hypothetical protein
VVDIGKRSFQQFLEGIFSGLQVLNQLSLSLVELNSIFNSCLWGALLPPESWLYIIRNIFHGYVLGNSG